MLVRQKEIGYDDVFGLQPDDICSVNHNIIPKGEVLSQQGLLSFSSWRKPVEKVVPSIALELPAVIQIQSSSTGTQI